MSLIDRMRMRKRDAAALKRLLENAELKAAARGDERVGAEHLLLAALEMDNSAARAFAAVGAEASAFAPAIAAQNAEALKSVGVTAAAEGEEAVSPKRFASFDASFEAAIKATYEAHAKDRALRAADVVAGACSVEHGVCARALAAMGVSREHLAEAAVAAAADGDGDL